MIFYINAYSNLFAFLGLSKGLNTHQCTHEKNYHHNMNYLNLDYSNFLIQIYFMQFLFVKTSEKKVKISFFHFFEPQP